MKRPFLDVAKDLFNERFSEAKVMFISGSLVRGEGTENPI